MYKIIDEKLGLASCSLSDLTMHQVSCFLDQWEDDAPISSLTLFYDKKRDLVVLNRDNAEFDRYLDIAEVILKADMEKIQKLKDKVPCGCRETVELLINVKKRRETNLEITMALKNDITGGNYFSVLDDICNRFDRIQACSVAFRYGIIVGKRKERSRRKK